MMPTVRDIYTETIKPLSIGDKLSIARMIMDEVVPNEDEPAFDRLQRLLPNIERMTITDRELAEVRLDSR